jgi:hypothetical protein
MYFELLENLGIEPNFFCSDEFFEKAGFEIVEEEDAYWVEYEGGIMFPPIPIDFFDFREYSKIWLGLDGIEKPQGWHSTFFDYEFIYNPAHFANMWGGEWRTFRKNVRKFPSRYPASTNYLTLHNDNFVPTDEEIMALFTSWLDSTHKEEIHDPDIILDYLLGGDNRGFLIDENGKLLGINCWDYNWKFINFRFCFHNCNYPFLSEYLRFLFFTDPEIAQDGRLVNDGGSLGSEALFSFKEKLNPVLIRSMFSWEKVSV